MAGLCQHLIFNTQIDVSVFLDIEAADDRDPMEEDEDEDEDEESPFSASHSSFHSAIELI